MSIIDTVKEQLSKPTFIFGIPLWVFAGIGLGLFILLILWFICCCCCCRRSKSTKTPKHPIISSNEKKIHKIENFSTSSTNIPTPDHQSVLPPNPNVPEIKIDIGKTEHQDDVGRPVGSRHWSYRYREGLSREDIGLDSMAGAAVAATAPKEEVGHLQWGRLFTLRELKEATNNFSEDYNMIGEGNYGIVYRGVLSDNTPVAVKSLFNNNRDRAGKDFQFEMEAVGNIRHKNLLKLLGYCVEGASRMLVYEYLENGNLNQWLHKDITQVSPLSWGIRMNIILGTVKALTYLHEGLEPKIVHRDVKSCNILLDRKWNPKVSDFGFAKLLSSEMSHVTTRVMGTYGYVAPEYACTGLLNERSDVYSFGVLVMEIVTGRSPEEMDLVDWLKRMIKKQRFDEIADPKLPELPSSKALKRVLVIALQCVDPEALLRPTMGQVMHMLESDNFPDKLQELQELQASRSCR